MRFCTHCGAPLAGPSADQPADQPAHPVEDTAVRGGAAVADPGPEDTSATRASLPRSAPPSFVPPPPLPAPPPLFVDEVEPQPEDSTLASYLLTPSHPESSGVAAQPRVPPRGASRGAGRRGGYVVAAAVLALVVGVGGGFAIAALTGDDPDVDTSASSSGTGEESPTPQPDGAGRSETPSADPTGDAARADLPPVGRLEAGLSCLELKERGYDFAAADRYWSRQGQPAGMDADANGIPCETRFDETAIRAVYGARVDAAETDVTRLAPGLGCPLLVEYGVDYPAVAGYWEHEGRPRRLDRNRDGRPCDEAYPVEAVSDYWG